MIIFLGHNKCMFGLENILFLGVVHKSYFFILFLCNRLQGLKLYFFLVILFIINNHHNNRVASFWCTHLFWLFYPLTVINVMAHSLIVYSVCHIHYSDGYTFAYPILPFY